MTKTNPTETAGKSPNPAKNETKAEHAIKEQAKRSALPEAEIKTPDSTNTPAHEEHDLSHLLISPLDGQRIAIAPQKRKARHGFEYDAVVLGAGPAGEAAAMKLAKSGLKVAVIDPRDQVGGNCAHVGTIPSKALRQSVFNIISMRRDPIFSSFTDNFQVPLNKVLSKARRVIASQVNTHKLFYERNRVEIIQGWGRFIDKNTLEVEQVHGEGAKTVTFEKAVIAVGSRPYRPDLLDFDHPRVFDSDKILQMDYVARKIIIYGAGVIGCEYASIFTGLGYVVDLINNKEQLLSYLDDEISDALSHDFRQFGVRIRSNEEIERLETFDDCVVLHLKSGKKIKSDAILWCNGRSGNTDGLNLEAVGLSANSRGQLEVDQTYRTKAEHIYAVGDVIGWPSLASAAYDQGRNAAGFMVGDKHAEFVNSVPTGIYTIPEISSIGATEEDLTRDQIPYEVGQAFFKHLARSQIIGERSGVLKILFHRETLQILGIHCYGNHASEIIHIGQAVMKCGHTLEYFINTTFNYPTMAEAYRVAALNGMNRIF
ncbi:Soluble pyridine nucleotide transhydrogenase [Moraxella lacunata]|uniref:Soluble pyridine nucleotide transhydrogenase n=1 Tax=Moraxella lacunata TaxID=477 RepID=A0A378TUL4_MORLA|nr:Si-specific NAD(P)(+) transhydrogenase [Moraxella lacunata]STZ63964.1 Soluble pyridine nucleotide transhydrogenase [Moraxella lacunata]